MDNDPQGNTEVLISPYTNRPITVAIFKPQIPVYWCSICCKCLSGPGTASQHLAGRTHRNKEEDKNKRTSLKQKRQLNPGTTVHEPVVKKAKDLSSKSKGSDPDLHCVECDLTFNVAEDLIEHFKHIKHSTQKSNFETIDDDVQLKCELCDIVFHYSSCATEHYEGKKHKRAVLVKEAAKQREILITSQLPGNYQSRKPTISKRGRGYATVLGKSFVKPTGGTTMGYSYKKEKVLPGFVKASHGPIIWSHETNFEASNSSPIMAFVSPLPINLSINARHMPDNTEQSKPSDACIWGNQNTVPMVLESPIHPKEHSLSYVENPLSYVEQKCNEYLTSSGIEQSNDNYYYNTVSDTSYIPNTLDSNSEYIKNNTEYY